MYFSSLRADDIMNGYFDSSLLTTTSPNTTTTASATKCLVVLCVAVSGEGRAPEIPKKKSVIISLRTRQHRLYVALICASPSRA